MTNNGTGRNFACILPCGCYEAVCLVLPGDKQMARQVAKWISEGRNVQQVTTEQVRESRWECTECKPNDLSDPRRRHEH